MKKIIAVVIIFVTFVLAGSTLEQEDITSCRSILSFGETYSERNVKITLVDCVYTEDKTVLTFDFENNLNEERHFVFSAYGSENFVSRDIKYDSLKINGEARVLEKANDTLANDKLYFNPLEKGTMIVVFNENLENELDNTREYYYVITGFYAMSFSFKDNRAWLEGID